ncbi:GAF domain-containing protein [Cellulosilyticum sp. I15G10I2]|uniref:GAF domain-containing protein n=1 Tax=Cellulosilyticum sp. I15G10I2 TaxID=1892843 RepID=UPI00085BB40B|nr:hypothetical protein [Cellulosilyticum sp. I15G10I2]
MADNKITSNGYRYQALLQAIDFFTQRFSLEQISNYAFEFTNEILTLNASALFVREGHSYILKKNRLYNLETYKMPCTKKLKELPVRHGDIIVNHFDLFFDEHIVKALDIELVIPLIIDDYLYGFILSNGKMIGHFDEDDGIIASALMKLFANSLGNSKQLSELGQKNKLLDQKIFNLFAINQSAKSLLSQVELEDLYTLATDIFSEMTCSRVTSFGIYDEVSETIKVLGYRNVSNYSNVFTELRLASEEYVSSQIVLDFNKDLKIIQALFENWEELTLLETRYIVLLIKDKILGVVTLSEPVNDRVYDEATFELVETLASFTHIAISNALLFKKLLVQNDRVKRKFHTLNTLNKIIQNINSGVTIDELFSLTLKVLALNFGVKKAFFAYYNEDHYTVVNTVGLQIENIAFGLNKRWEKVVEGEVLLDFKENALYDFFEEHLVCQIGASNCMIIAPICTGIGYESEESLPKGFLVVAQTHDSLKEEEILLIDTITKNISPVIYQMDLNCRMQKEYQIDPLHQFISAVEIKLVERSDYELDFYLFYKILDLTPFQKSDDLLIEGEECYIVDQFIFLLSYEDEISDKSFCLAPYFNTIEEVKQFDYISFYKQQRYSKVVAIPR